MLRRNSGESKEVVTDEDLPSELCCPITYQPYVKPVLGSDGRFYELDAIKTHLARDNKSPFTREILQLQQLPNAVCKKIKDVIDECKEKSNEWRKKLKATDEKLSQISAAIVDKDKEIDRLQTELAIAMSSHSGSSAHHLQTQIENLSKINAKLEETVNDFKNNLIKNQRPKVDISFPPGALTQSFHNSRFLKAVRSLSIQEAEYYLREGADINARDHDTKETALIITTIKREENPDLSKQLMAMLLRQKGIDIDARDHRGCTALHRAASSNDEWAVHELLMANANPLITNNFWQTANQFGMLIHGEKFNKNIYLMLQSQTNNYFAKNNSHEQKLFTSQKRKPLLMDTEEEFKIQSSRMEV